MLWTRTLNGSPSNASFKQRPGFALAAAVHVEQSQLGLRADQLRHRANRLAIIFFGLRLLVVLVQRLRQRIEKLAGMGILRGDFFSSVSKRISPLSLWERGRG